MKRIGLAVIGCGGHGIQAHAVPCCHMGSVDLKGVFDPSDKAIGEAEKALGKVHRFTSCKEIWENQEINAVIIASPDQFHAQTLKEAVDAGKHVFIEKPVATSLKELKAVQATLRKAEKKGLIISSCHPRRFDPPFIKMKKMLPGFIKKFGQVIRIEFDFTYHKPSCDWKHARSLMLDHANHEIDLVHFLLDSFKPITATKMLDGHDRYEVQGVREDGISIAFTGTRMLENKIYREKLIMRFPRGLVELDTHTGMLRVVDHDKTTEHIMKIGKTDYEVRCHDINVDFFESIRGKKEPYLFHADMLFNTGFCLHLQEGTAHFVDNRGKVKLR